MKVVARPGAQLEGAITVPGDKSVSHRAVMLGSLARGRTEISNLLLGADCLATVAAFREMGVHIELDGTICCIDGVDMSLAEPNVLDIGNSGTTMRLLTGLLSGAGVFAVITGDASIRRRPMGRVIAPLTQMGAHLHARAHGTLAPIAIAPSSLHGISYISPVASAQVKSALLLAGLWADGSTMVSEPLPSRDHTERMLADFGVHVTRPEGPCSAMVAGGQALKGARVAVPGDISSAAFPLAAGILSCGEGAGVRVSNVGTNPTRNGLLEVLSAWGVQVREEPCGSGSEPAANLEVEPQECSASSFGGCVVPRLIDEIPMLAFLAAFATGECEITGAAELRVKESDRIGTTVSALRRGGVDASELPDGLLVRGGGPRFRFRGGSYPSHGDHRLAMSLCIAALRADSPVEVTDADCIATSFPDFVETMNALSVSGPWLERR